MVETTDPPIEVVVRKGRDYMTHCQRARYCRFQRPDYVQSFAEDLTAGVPPGPDGIRHVVLASRVVKQGIEYDRTDLFPRPVDHMLEADSVGDCVDQCVLLVSLLEALGRECRYCCCHVQGQPAGHCAVEVRFSGDPATQQAVGATVRSMAPVDTDSPASWDRTEQGTWLLVDPTSPLPPGLDRGIGFEVRDDGIRWREDIDLVCFQSVERDN